MSCDPLNFHNGENVTFPTHNNYTCGRKCHKINDIHCRKIKTNPHTPTALPVSLILS